jgi:hypothetical protein
MEALLILVVAGYPQEPVVIFEDNKALIDIIRRGNVSSGNLTANCYTRY